MSGVYNEPTNYKFRNQFGHHGKFFATSSEVTEHLIIECDDKLTVSLRRTKVEFDYYVVQGSGYFVIDNKRHNVKVGDLIIISPGTLYTFGGKLKMLLINTPHLDQGQEEVIA